MSFRTIALFAVAVAATLPSASASASDHGERGERGEHEEHGHHGELEGRDRRARRHDGPRAEDGRAAEDGGGPARPAAPPGSPARALYAKECGACHLAFPPGLLPAESHRRILAGLERHFGQNAELEPAFRDRLERYLVENAAEAGTDRRSRKVLASLDVGPAPLRITESPWFRRKHRRVGDDVVARPSIGSRANCAACHAGAPGWDFDEDGVKIPSGRGP